jgi:hypothetical protein
MAFYKFDYTIARKYTVFVEAKNRDEAEKLRNVHSNGVTDGVTAVPREIANYKETITSIEKITPHVHYLHNGVAMCGAGMPENFSIVRDGKVFGSKWTDNWDDVDCPGCLAK